MKSLRTKAVKNALHKLRALKARNARPRRLRRAQNVLAKRLGAATKKPGKRGRNGAHGQATI
jgi:hypothetical protein